MHKLLDNIELLVPVGESFELHVKGYSMLPMLGFGDDVIIVRRIDAEEHIVGRIAMFRGAQNQIIVHRVLSVTNGVVVLQGDGNIIQTEECQRGEIIGVVDMVRRASGKVIDCTTPRWRRRERLWLSLPCWVRGKMLGAMRRWLDYKRKKR